MANVEIQEITYSDFASALSKATLNDQILEKVKDSEWLAWVKKEGIKEASFKALSRNYHDGLTPVIIKDGAWKGYYYYSKKLKFCLKWVEL